MQIRRALIAMAYVAALLAVLGAFRRRLRAIDEPLGFHPEWREERATAPEDPPSGKGAARPLQPAETAPASSPSSIPEVEPTPLSSSAGSIPEADTSRRLCSSFVLQREDDSGAPRRVEVSLLSPVLWLLRNQNADGSWGDVPEGVDGCMYDRSGATAIALLGFLGAGYSHLSRDTYDGQNVGQAVKRAFRWLIEQQPTDPLNAALVAQALTEAYGITGSLLLEEPAQQSIDRLLRLQRADGSWAAEPTVNFFAAEALRSAHVSGVPVSSDGRARAIAYFESALARSTDPAFAMGYIFLARDRAHPTLSSAMGALLAAPPHAIQNNYSYWYLGTHALFGFDGARGAAWGAWSDRMRDTLLSSLTCDGNWSSERTTSGIVRHGLGTLTLQVYYRYPNAFGSGPSSHE